jgi:hypothetical protein
MWEKPSSSIQREVKEYDVKKKVTYKGENLVQVIKTILSMFLDTLSFKKAGKKKKKIEKKLWTNTELCIRDTCYSNT